MSAERPLADARAELARLQAALTQTTEELQEARAALQREQERKQMLARANSLLERELFQAALKQEVLRTAERGEDLARFCEALFDFIARVVKMRHVGLLLSWRGTERTFCFPAEDGKASALLTAWMRDEPPSERPDCFHYAFGNGERLIGHLICLADDSRFTPQDLDVLKGVCEQASPLLERSLLFGAMQEMADFHQDFVHMLSHDLRNPLTAIISALGLVALPHLPMPGPERDRLLETARNNAQLANELIGDLLDVAKSEAGKLVLADEPVDLAEVAEECLARQAPMAAPRKLVMALDAPPDLPAVAGDRRKLLRVLMNLVSNALKYTQWGGVVIRLRQVGDRLEGVVADTGLGVPLEAQSRLFGKFYQVHDRKRGPSGGTGLGLAFCREMIEAHGGHIWVESPSDEALSGELLPPPGERRDPGSAFRFTLPVWQEGGD